MASSDGRLRSEALTKRDPQWVTADFVKKDMKNKRTISAGAALKIWKRRDGADYPKARAKRRSGLASENLPWVPNCRASRDFCASNPFLITRAEAMKVQAGPRSSRTAIPKSISSLVPTH